MKRIRTAIATLALVAGLAPVSLAQNPGDLVFWHYGPSDRLLLTAPADQLGSPTTLWDTGGYVVWNVAIDHGNDGILAFQHPSSLVRITGAKAATTVMTLPAVNAPLRHMARDQDGTLLMAGYTNTPNEAHIARVDHTTSSYSTLLTIPRNTIQGLCRDERTGDFLVVTQTGHLLTVDRTSGSAATVTTLDTTPYYRALCYIPGRDLFALSVGSRTTLAGQIAFMTRTGAIQGRINLTANEGQAHCLSFDESRNLLHVGTSTGYIISFTPSGTRVRSHDYGAAYVSCIDVWGDRPLSLRTTGRPGDNLELTLRFLRSPNRPYAAAFSLGLGAPTQIGGQHLFAALDPLFFATVSQLPGFGGMLAADGSKTINFRIPMSLPRGFVVYATAFAQNQTLPGGFDLGNTECLRIE